MNQEQKEKEEEKKRQEEISNISRDLCLNIKNPFLSNNYHNIHTCCEWQSNPKYDQRQILCFHCLLPCDRDHHVHAIIEMDEHTPSYSARETNHQRRYIFDTSHAFCRFACLQAHTKERPYIPAFRFLQFAIAYHKHYRLPHFTTQSAPSVTLNIYFKDMFKELEKSTATVTNIFPLLSDKDMNTAIALDEYFNVRELPFHKY